MFFQLQAFQVQAFIGGQVFPLELIEASGYQMVTGNLHRLVDQLLKLGFLAFLFFPVQFVFDIDTFNPTLLGQHS